MKRFLSAVGLCASLLLVGLFVFLPATNAQKSLLETLLDLPAPPPPNPLVTRRMGNRALANFDKDKPPTDDVPLEDLLAYWQRMNNFDQKFTYTPDPTDRTLERIIEEVEKNPERLPSLMNAFRGKPQGVSVVKRIYEREVSDKRFGRDWRESVKRWLTYNSDMFSGDLAEVAGASRDTSEYVTNQDEVLALARVDWEKAKPILNRMLNDSTQPVSQTLARWAFYEHAMRERDSIDAERWRKELQRTVETKTEKPGNRDLAMDALVEAGDFEGRDDWYFSLLEDETLHDLRVNGASYTGLTTIIRHSPSDKYIAKMLEYARSGSAAVRSAAVRNLATVIDDKHRDVVEALLPWLEDPKWAQETNGERRQLIAALREFQIAESVPGLIAVLNEKSSPDARYGSMSNRMIMNSNGMTMPPPLPPPMVNSATLGGTSSNSGAMVDYYPYRDEAIYALTTQKDVRAATALRTILPQVEDWQRGGVVRAILMSRGFSIPEQLEALEAMAKNVGQMESYSGNTMMMSNVAVVNNSIPDMMGEMDTVVGVPSVSANMKMGNSYVLPPRRPFDAADIKPLLGMQLVNLPDADEELVTALIERIAVLDKKDPPVAAGLRRIMQNWKGAAVNRLLLQDLKNNRANLDAVVKLLSLRKELREKQWNDVNDVRSGGATAFGISACLIEDAQEYDAILQGENLEAKTAMLGCARLIRADLPVELVAANLKSPTKILAAAAERYLIAEDSPEARRLVLALHPNEALVLGARTNFETENSSGTAHLAQLFASVNEASSAANYYYYGGSDESLTATETNLRKEVRENQELLGIYAYNDNFVRMYKDRAVFSWQEDKARYRERELDKNEFENLTGYLTAENAPDLPPFLADCTMGASGGYDYYEDEEGGIGGGGGISGGESGIDCTAKELLMLGRQGGRRVFTFGDKPKFFAGLETIFSQMREPPAKLHYHLEKGVTGLEILFENDALQAVAVWKLGDDFRVLINSEARRKEIDKEIQRQDEADEERIAELAGEEDYEKYEKLEKERRERRARREYENYTWHKFLGGKLLDAVGQPNGAEFLPKFDGTGVRSDNRQWKARAAAFEIRSDESGLYKVTGGRSVKVREGFYYQPIVTANGRWVVAARYAEEEGRQLVRLNLQTNREYVVNSEEYPVIENVAYVPSINKILMFAGGYSEYEGEADGDYSAREGEFFFLDADTGAMQKAKGEVRPLAQQTYRPLQPTGKPDEVWAAIPDAANSTQVGVYNLKTLTFKPLVKIPQITFNSMQMWIDAGKIYFVYEGHLLGLPFPKAAAPAE